jgi:hypothetical protein
VPATAAQLSHGNTIFHQVYVRYVGPR